eukprot:14647718-Alexandrium_andersonii.AAC.1
MCHTAMHCTALHFHRTAELHHAATRFIAPHRIVQHPARLHHLAQHCTAPHSTAQRHAAPQCAAEQRADHHRS